MQQRRDVIISVEEGNGAAALSFFAMVIIAAVIGLLIWQPWDTTSGSRFMTITTQQTTYR
jgi:hypothetical protein